MTSARVRGRQLRLLLGPTVRALRWQPLPVAVAAATLLLWWRDPQALGPGSVVWELRAVGLLLVAGVACAFDDHTRATVAAVPAPLWFRSGLRGLLLAGPAGLTWAGMVTWADSRVGGALPVWSLSLEVASASAVVVAVAATLARWPGLPDPGVVAGPLLAGFAFGAPGLPHVVALLTLPGAGWREAHLRWAGLLLVAALAVAVAVRDPAARRQLLPS